MNDYKLLKQLYRDAVRFFPFPDLKRSGDSKELFEDESDGDGIYVEDFTFTAGNVLHSRIKAEGGIEIIKDKDTYEIVALFWLTTTINGDHNSPLLEKGFVWGMFQAKNKTWDLRLETLKDLGTLIQ